MKVYRDWSEISIVSGLPRSGTSLMMNILAALQEEIFYDDGRESDESNPGGYFESQLIKGIPRGDIEFLSRVNGWIKITANYLPYICDHYRLKIIYMDRELEEVAVSQSKMIDEGIDDLHKQVSLLAEAKERAQYFMRSRLNVEYKFVRYDELVGNPRGIIQEICNFAGIDRNIDDAVAVVDKKLYRNKGSL